MTDATGTQALDHFWEVARQHADLAGVPTYTGENPLSLLRPPAWAFGASRQQADWLLQQLLADGSTTTSTPLADYEAEGALLPEAGTLGIVLDGAGRPRALVVTSEVQVDTVGAVVTERFRRLYP